MTAVLRAARAAAVLWMASPMGQLWLCERRWLAWGHLVSSSRATSAEGAGGEEGVLEEVRPCRRVWVGVRAHRLPGLWGGGRAGIGVRGRQSSWGLPSVEATGQATHTLCPGCPLRPPSPGCAGATGTKCHVRFAVLTVTWD